MRQIKNLVRLALVSIAVAIAILVVCPRVTSGNITAEVIEAVFTSTPGSGLEQSVLYRKYPFDTPDAGTPKLR